MGDMADMINDCWVEDEFTHEEKLYGLGECPECGGETQLITGKYGKFYGCKNFPKCTGSRNY